ncbi:neuronal acetylcholine receptor subunit alpha-10-like [Glandiceps talaboti]
MAWLFTFVVIVVPAAIAKFSTDKLVTNLLYNDHYQKIIRPVENSSTAVIVKHRMTPVQIIDLEEKAQIITLKSWCGQVWTDEYLKWNPNDYDGTDEIQLPISEIWQPDIVLHERTTEKFERHYDTDVRIKSSGEVTAIQPFVFKSSCFIDATYFPFDDQKCTFKFGSWIYPLKLIDVVPDNRSNLNDFVRNNEWILLNMDVERSILDFPCCPESFAEVKYTIYLKRRSLYYLLNIVVPAFLVSFLAVIAFYLPSDSGERITLCISSMLALMMFLSVVSDFMPPNSERIPYIQLYLFLTIVVVALSCVTTATTLNLHFCGPTIRRAPPCLRNLVLNYVAHAICNKASLYKNCESWTEKPKRGNGEIRLGEPDEISEYDQKHHANNLEIGEETNHERKINVAFEGTGETCEEQLYKKWSQEWKEIARILDRMFVWIYAICVLSLNAGFVFFLNSREGKE